MSRKLEYLTGKKEISFWSKQDHINWLKKCIELVKNYKKEMEEAWDSLEELETMLTTYPQNGQYHTEIRDFKEGSDGIQELITVFEGNELRDIESVLETVQKDLGVK